MGELNGERVNLEDLKALALVNYGHFTSMRVDNRRVRGLTRHLERLARDCHILFNADLDLERVRSLARQSVGDRSGSCVVRVTVFDPALELGHPGMNAQPQILITIRSAAPLPLPPLRVTPVRYSREMPAVKHVGLFGALWHRRAAQLNGFDDALFTDASSFVSEGATWNIGFFDGNDVVWPESDCLTGVTMDLLRAAHDRTKITPVSTGDIPGMHAAFATNTAIGVRAISAVGDVPLADDHPVLELLRKEYADIPAEPL